MNALRLNRPYAIMVVGIPGSGKSFFARQFSDMFKVPYYDTATITAHALDQDAADELIALILGEYTKTEQTFLFEGASLTEDQRAEFSKWVQSKGYKPLFIWVQTAPATSQGRAAKSGLSREDFAELLDRFEPPKQKEQAVVISGRHTYATQAKVVLNHLARLNRANARLVQSPRVQAKPTARHRPIQ